MTTKLKSAKTLLIAGAALAVSATAVLPALAQSTGTTTNTPPAASQTQPTRPLPFRAEVMFNMLDQNGDGSLDQTEVANLEKAIFDTADTNHDGKISKDEFQAIGRGFAGRGGPGMRGPNDDRGGPGMRGPDGRGFRMGDHDGRGPQGRPGYFGRGGQDGRWGQNGPQGGRWGQNGPQGGPGQMGPQNGPGQQGNAGPQGGPGANRSFSNLDTNGDGVITPDEFAAGGPGSGMGQ